MENGMFKLVILKVVQVLLERSRMWPMEWVTEGESNDEELSWSLNGQGRY